MIWYNPNRALTTAEMQHNANNARVLLAADGWTLNAICAILGNMQLESTINPGRWEEGVTTNPGFGLTQWTPSSKLQNWIKSTYGTTDYSNGDKQIARIIWESLAENQGVQWIPTASYPLTFREFAVSNLSISYLTAAFEYNYERGTPMIDTRVQYANYWYNYFGSFTPPPKWLLFKFRR